MHYRVRVLRRWSVMSAVVALWALWSSPRAHAFVPISQPGQAPPKEVTPSMRPPAQGAGPGQSADPDAPPAPPPRSPDLPATNTHFGLGYKLGNGLGFLGADAILSPLPHVALDFQVSAFSAATTGGSASGVGLAPMLQLFFSDPGRSTPYLGFGWLHASASLQNITASVSGYAANVGYEWKWSSGFGILLGGGVAVLGKATATDGVNTVSISGGVHPNLELGLRFLFI
jgi:hypothetical protein